MAYDQETVHETLVTTKAAIKTLKMIPFQRRWAEGIRSNQLKLEISGTSRIEGADFLGGEFDTAMRAATHADLMTRSQKQARSALEAYEWVAKLPDDQPISAELIKTIHRLVVAGCDDDHCEPGGLRKAHQNVTFGFQRYRGVQGGRPCAEALERLATEAATTFQGHDPLIQAIATHYHFAAMHPFLDGNGRTARTLEALLLQRVGLKEVFFVPMSNFYHQAQNDYLSRLGEARSKNHDLTPFLTFALRGLEAEVSRLTETLLRSVSKGIFRNFLDELEAMLARTRMRVIVKRQLNLLSHLLDKDREVEIQMLATDMHAHYKTRKDPLAALTRDIIRLEGLGAVRVRFGSGVFGRSALASINLDWPKTMTGVRFFELVKELPKRNGRYILAA